MLPVKSAFAAILPAKSGCVWEMPVSRMATRTFGSPLVMSQAGGTLIALIFHCHEGYGLPLSIRKGSFGCKPHLQCNYSPRNPQRDCAPGHP